MRVHLVPFDGTEAVTTLVLINVGSRNEDLPVWGGSHFIEHMMFKGTERRPQSIDISKEVDRFGAHYNAYTGKEVTGYYIKMAADKAELAVDLLNDMIFHSKYDPEEMEREKKVIIEEIKMYEENPIMHIGDLLEQAMYAGHELGREIAGTATSMTGMKREDVITYRDRHYKPSEIVIVMAGNVPENAEELLESTFGTVASSESPNKPVEFKLPEGYKGNIKFQTKDLDQAQVAFGFPSVGRTHDDLPAIKLLAHILGGAMSSRLFIEVRERRGLCYSIRAGADAYQDIGSFVIRAGLDASRLKEASKVIMDELEKIKTEGATLEELQAAKDNFKGSLSLSMEDSSSRAEFFGRQELFVGKVLSVEEWLDRYNNVTIDDIKRVAETIIKSEQMSIAAIGPYKSEESVREATGMIG